MNQKRNVIKFPRRGRFVREPARPFQMTPDRQARGQEWIAKLRRMLQEDGDE